MPSTRAGTMPLDLSSLRISDSASAAVAVKSYAFKPKLTASAAEGLKLVLVVAEDGKDIGKASALAKLLASEGVKDLRAAEDGLVNETLGVSRADGALEELKDRCLGRAARSRPAHSIVCI